MQTKQNSIASPTLMSTHIRLHAYIHAYTHIHAQQKHSHFPKNNLQYNSNLGGLGGSHFFFTKKAPKIGAFSRLRQF